MSIKRKGLDTKLTPPAAKHPRRTLDGESFHAVCLPRPPGALDSGLQPCPPLSRLDCSDFHPNFGGLLDLARCRCEATSAGGSTRAPKRVAVQPKVV